MCNLLRPENMEMNRKPKKTYLLTVCVSIIYFTLIVCIINNCRQITQDYVDEYKLHVEKISNLEDDTITLAGEFMQSEYDKHWDTMKGCWGRIANDMVGYYELGIYIIPERYATLFYRKITNNIDKSNQNTDSFSKVSDTHIICNAYANNKSEFDNKNIVIAFNYYDSISSITVYIEYFGGNSLETVIFNIDLIDNEYVADRIDAEELTGLTIEEIVEAAELNRKGFEDLMLAMKEHELEESKNDLNTSLKNLYTFAAFLIIVLLTVWIVVLIVILKCSTQNRNSRRKSL